MDRLHAMRVFVKVAEVGGFAEASRQLFMGAPAVTRAVGALEDQIGVRLFIRNTRSIKLTEAGAQYLSDCRRILSDIAEAEASAAGSYSKATGTLTVTASVLFGEMYVLPILTEFLDKYPDVAGRVLLLDRVVNLVEEGIDVAVRIGHLPDSSQSAVRVGTVRRVICGSPEYFAKHGVPAKPCDLAAHRIIAATSAWTSLEWRFGQEQKTSVTVMPRLYCNSNQGAIDAAMRGWGLTRVLSYQVGPALVAGTLQTVLADYEEEPLPVHILYPEGRKAFAKVKAFVAFAAERLRANNLIN